MELQCKGNSSTDSTTEGHTLCATHQIAITCSPGLLGKVLVLAGKIVALVGHLIVAGFDEKPSGTDTAPISEKEEHRAYSPIPEINTDKSEAENSKDKKNIKQRSCNDVDWNSVGDGIRDGLEQVDWKGIGETVRQWCNEVDWEKVGDDIHEGVQKVDWKEVSDGIRHGFEAVDWKEVGDEISAAFLKQNHEGNGNLSKPTEEDNEGKDISGESRPPPTNPDYVYERKMTCDTDITDSGSEAGRYLP